MSSKMTKTSSAVQDTSTLKDSSKINLEKNYSGKIYQEKTSQEKVNQEKIQNSSPNPVKPYIIVLAILGGLLLVSLAINIYLAIKVQQMGNVSSSTQSVTLDKNLIVNGIDFAFNSETVTLRTGQNNCANGTGSNGERRLQSTDSNANTNINVNTNTNNNTNTNSNTNANNNTNTNIYVNVNVSPCKGFQKALVGLAMLIFLSLLY